MSEEQLHRWFIEEREYARQLERRGRLHAYDHLDPQRTALVVIDMVPFFVTENPYCRGIIPNINALAESLRSRGGQVAWVLPKRDPSPSQWAKGFYGERVAERFNDSGGEGQLPDRLWHELDTAGSDLFVEKNSSSAFFPQKCELPELLEERGIESVLICGTVTNVCCESSARDAATLGFQVVMVADANATIFDEWHNATLRTIYRSFGDVRSTSEMIEMIAK